MSTLKIIRIPVIISQKSYTVLEDEEIHSLDEASRHIPAGVYTTFRTYQKFFVLHLRDHFERLENSASLTGKGIQLDRDRIRIDLRKALIQFPEIEARVRVSIDLTKEIGEVYLILEGLHTPSREDYHSGVAVITRTMHRENPEAKVTSFIAEASEIRKASSQLLINETLMVSEDGSILEGLSSNFFAVRNDVIYTAGKGILQGITRKTVVDIAESIGISVNLQPMKVGDLSHYSEAFITSASRAILPVIRIDDRVVGNGQVGKITQALQIAFQSNLDTFLEEI
ncbi:MAG TPA: aminotransferase class IV [Longilinea sp.]|nr:aminotransferase class IV [Longilinea sp.]